MQVDLYNGRKTVVVVTAVIMVSIVSMHTIRVCRRCYFNMRSKADMSQLNLLHGYDN